MIKYLIPRTDPIQTDPIQMTPFRPHSPHWGTDGDIAYKLTDNIAYTFVSVLRADRADHQHDFWQLDPPVLACPALLPDPASSSVGYGSAGEQPERWILPTGLPASGPQCIRVNLSRKSRLPLILKGKMKISPDLSK